MGTFLFATPYSLLAGVRLAHAYEFLRVPVEHEQRAFGDAEIGAVQLQRAAFDLSGVRSSDPDTRPLMGPATVRSN